MKTIIAIDPGERWTGIAVMQVMPELSVWLFGVLDSRKDYLRPVTVLESVLSRTPNPFLVLEDYRVRPVGHQRFTRGITLRAIGALEYVARRSEVEQTKIPPGNIDQELNRLGIDRILRRWRKNWTRVTNWEHGRSAWRLMGQHVLRHCPDHGVFFDRSIESSVVLNSIARKTADPWIPHLENQDLWAPPLTVRIHR